MECGFVIGSERHALTVAEMNAREDQGLKMGISHIIMMENAGAAIARFIASKWDKRTNVLLLAGTGNNGGDAFVAARHLAFWKNFEISVVLVGSESHIRTDEAATNWRILKQISRIRTIAVDSSSDSGILSKLLRKADIIVSAIFGTGFRGRASGVHLEVIDEINSSRAAIISVDLPSGMEGDTGKYEAAVISDYTITMDSPKKGLMNPKSKSICGEILVASIGVPL